MNSSDQSSCPSQETSQFASANVALGFSCTFGDDLQSAGFSRKRACRQLLPSDMGYDMLKIDRRLVPDADARFIDGDFAIMWTMGWTLRANLVCCPPYATQCAIACRTSVKQTTLRKIAHVRLAEVCSCAHVM